MRFFFFLVGDFPAKWNLGLASRGNAVLLLSSSNKAVSQFEIAWSAVMSAV